MLPKSNINKIDIVKGSIKSGYSTTVLVHKEGIMTNEEIYKYADKKLAKAQNRYYLRYLVPVVFSIIGWALMTYPLSASESNIVVGSIIVFGIIAFSIIIVLCNNLLKTWFVERREYIANLVRQDERQRCFAKLQKYEHEGSK